MSKPQHYTVTVTRVPTKLQRQLQIEEHAADVAGDRRDSVALDSCEQEIADIKAAMEAAGEEPCDPRPVSNPPPWTREMGIAMLQRCQPGCSIESDDVDGLVMVDGYCVAPGSPAALAAWMLVDRGRIPHELVPYLPSMVEGTPSAEPAQNVKGEEAR